MKIENFIRKAIEAGTLPDSTNRIDQLTEAIAVAEKAYAPYSKFKVGCVLVTSEDGFYLGCNVENVMYNGMSHAELTAITAAIVQEGPQMMIAEMTIWTPTDEPTPSCGGCRQLIREHALNTGIEIHSYCNDPSKYLMMTVDELLPNSFGPECL
jgi:cytidine deaminase